jgi:hypothetical protein
MTSVSLFWKSYFQDLRWLQYSLRSVRKHWKDPYTKEYIVAIDEDCHEDLQRYDFLGEFNWVKWRYVKPWPDKYTHQMVVKSYADEFTSADSVMILDSDLILKSDCTTKDFMSEGKPVIHFQPYSEKPGDTSEIWIKPTERILGLRMHHDFMVQGPFFYWSETLRNMRRRVVDATHKGFIEATYSDVPFDYKKFLEHPFTFSEFSALGLYAWNFESDLYAFEPPCSKIKDLAHQWHSWSQFEEAEPELERVFPG